MYEPSLFTLVDSLTEFTASENSFNGVTPSLKPRIPSARLFVNLDIPFIAVPEKDGEFRVSANSFSFPNNSCITTDPNS